ncbi:MAG: hypothetical protein J2P37_01580 [Ktedonobacteraceae bacterium]|nr:hypothetical protein [Ktedonobacteraceae bacterium]
MYLAKHVVDRIAHWRRSGCVWIILLMLLAACASNNPTNNDKAKGTTSGGPQLPGQQIWKDGVSSFLFGTNDSYEWADNNIQTVPAIQESLRAAGFTLIRSFFPDNASDDVIEKRMVTITNSGAQCLGVITNIANTNFNQHLVRYLGQRCRLYEFGNESDYNHISIEAYLEAWNKTIPLLRQINPQAKFIGPVTYNDEGNNGFMEAFLKGVKASRILPDAVSFHWYPCWNDTKEACLAKAGSYADAAQRVRQLVNATLGKDLPIGITEWNYDPGNPPPAYGDDPNFIKQFSTDALKSMISARVAFACQFDAASYGGYGRLDMFNIDSGEGKPQYYAIKDMIQQYRPSTTQTVPTVPASTPAPAAGSNGPLISRNQPVYCSGNELGANGPQSIVDGHYGNWSFWRTNVSALPGWCAIHVSIHATRLLLVWASDYSFDYADEIGMGPQDYTIAVSADSTDGKNGTWRTVATISGNHTRVREHLIPFEGQSWVKMTVTKGQPKAAQSFMTIDEIDLFDVSTSLDDTFVFSGDSITGTAFNRFNENQPSFAENVHAAYPQRFPAILDAGMGGMTVEGAVQSIDVWLALNPDIHYWALGWGTNDAFANLQPDRFKAYMQQLIDKIRQKGHVPIISHIPFANQPGDRGRQIDQSIRAYNVAIDQITQSNHLISGPDLYTLVRSHATTYLLQDGIHPSPTGAVAINKAWFEALQPVLYAR